MNVPDSSHRFLTDALHLLESAVAPHGIRASTTDLSNYGAVFARDGVMAGAAGKFANNSVVLAGFVRTLETLRLHQGPQGQIPSNVTLLPDGSHRVSFGRLSPKIDAATWYLIGVGWGIRWGLLIASDWFQSVYKTVELLNGLEYNGRHWIYVPQGGNWADEYPIDGYTLYDQVLRSWGLALCAEAFEQPEWLHKAQAIRDTLEPAYALEQHWAATVYPAGKSERFDLAAHTLLSFLFADGPSSAHNWQNLMGEQLKRSTPQLPGAFTPTITSEDPDWPVLQRFHLFGFKNQPYCYHNGGIWYIWLGWAGLALQINQQAELHSLLRQEALRAARALPQWDFPEYLHGLTLQPGGTPHLCFTAAGMIFLFAEPTDYKLLTPEWNRSN